MPYQITKEIIHFHEQGLDPIDIYEQLDERICILDIENVIETYEKELSALDQGFFDGDPLAGIRS